MKLRHAIQMMVVTGALALSSAAFADDSSATAFIQSRQRSIGQLLASKASASALTSELDKSLDYGELVQRCFQDDWKLLNEGQQREISDLLKKLIQKSYRKSVERVREYNVEYKSEKADGDAGTIRVKTSAQSKTDRRAPPVLIHYIVKGNDGSYRIVDIITENSSLTKNYYTQFHKILTNPSEGYPVLKKKVEDRIAKRD